MMEVGKLAVVGLGYVGLPLAVAFGRKRETLGFDINKERVQCLREGRDETGEVTADELAQAKHLSLSHVEDDLAQCRTFVITVPTPIDVHKRPDLSPLLNASRMVAKYLQPGSLVIYESTVYPGATEEDCVPVLEAGSGLTFNKDFFVGYSPERINPGDKTHRIQNIRKVTSGSTPEIAKVVDGLYSEIVEAGTHMASSIKVAEAAKIIENTQRDVNIALINEFALIFNKMGIDTEEVLLAAETKWNFLSFRPGLVGGHCIGVDPYYLTHKAESLDYHPDILMAARRLNDGMGAYVAQQLVIAMVRRGLAVKGAKILLMGFAFKENCPDLRNTKVIDIYRELSGFGAKVVVWDPWVDEEQARDAYGIDVNIEAPDDRDFDAAVLAVAHQEFRALGEEGVRNFLKNEGLVYDLKYVLPKQAADLRL